MKIQRLNILLTLLIFVGGIVIFFMLRRPEAATLSQSQIKYDDGQACKNLIFNIAQQDNKQQQLYSSSSPFWLSFNYPEVSLKTVEVIADNPNTDVSKVALTILQKSANNQFTTEDLKNGLVIKPYINGSTLVGSSVSLKNLPGPDSYTIKITGTSTCTDSEGKIIEPGTQTTIDMFRFAIGGSGKLLTGLETPTERKALEKAPAGNLSTNQIIEVVLEGISPDRLENGNWKQGNFKRIRDFLKDKYFAVFVSPFCNIGEVMVSAEGAITKPPSNFVGYLTSSSLEGFRWQLTSDVISKELLSVSEDADGHITSVKANPKNFTITGGQAIVPNLSVGVGVTDVGQDPQKMFYRGDVTSGTEMQIDFIDFPKDPIFIGGESQPEARFKYELRNKNAILSVQPDIYTQRQELTKEYTDAKKAVPAPADLDKEIFSATPSSGVVSPTTGEIIIKRFANTPGVQKVFVRGTYEVEVNYNRTTTAPLVGKTSKISNCQEASSSARVYTYKMKLSSGNPQKPELPLLEAGKEEGTKYEIGIDGFNKVGQDIYGKVDDADKSTTLHYASYIEDKGTLFSRIVGEKYKDSFLNYFKGKFFVPKIVDANEKIIEGFEFSLDSPPKEGEENNQLWSENLEIPIDTMDFVQDLYVRNVKSNIPSIVKLKLAIKDTSIAQFFDLESKELDYSIQLLTPEGEKDSLDLNSDFEGGTP